MRERVRRTARRTLRTALYSPMRPAIIATERRLHNHLFNCSTDSATNGEAWLIDRFDSSGVFLDVGFNQGEWSRAVAARERSRTIHAFDPARTVIERSDRYAPDVADFTFHPVALSDADGTATFHDYGDRHGSSSLGDRHAELGDAREYEVEVMTLDTWADRNSVEHIDVLKIDAEGFDLNIMEGGRGLFARQAIDVVVFEYASGWFTAGRTLLEASEFIAEMGYRMFRLFPEFLVPYTYRVQHEGAGMIGYFVALGPQVDDARFTVRDLVL